MAQPWQDWYRLDNAAMVYSAIQRDDYSAVYRFSVVMDHTVEPDLLQRAVQRVMPRFPGFQVRLRRGVFWSYFDADPSFVPPVEPDIANPCQPIRFSSKDRLLRVFYYGPRISIELFHALADGAGALVFLKTLAAEYLRQRGVEVPCTQGVLDPDQPPDPQEWEDAYPRYAISRARRRLKAKAAYNYIGTPEPFYTLNVTMGVFSVEKVHAAAKKYGVSITEFLAAGLIQALMARQRSEGRRREKPVALVIPINLRPYFPSKTLRNFILTTRPFIDPELGDYTFAEIAAQVHHYMRLHITRQEMQAYITQNVGLQRSPLLRWIPRPLKNWGMAAGFRMLGEKPYSATFSNPGVFQLPEAMQQHIRRVEMILGQSYSGRTNCSAISMGDTMALSFSGTMKEADLERDFFRWLVREGVPVKILSNRKD